MQIKNRIKELRQVKASELLPNPRNWRRHPTGQADALRGALSEIGYADALIAYETPDGLMLIDGHLRAETTPDMEVPVLVTDLDESEASKLLATLDPLSAMAEADTETLKLLRESVDINSQALNDMLTEIIQGDTSGKLLHIKEGLTDPDIVPKTPEVSWIQRGDLFQLGDHRVMCGDSTNAADVSTLMGGRMASLIHADPPYGMNKGFDNDNLHGQNLDQFHMQWWNALRPHVEDNASAYIWGNSEDLWRLWYGGGLKDSERLTLRNEIVRDKGGGGMSVKTEAGRMFQSSERCLFFMLGEQGYNNNADNYWEGWEPIRSKLEADCKKMGWGTQDIERICGVGMYSHWFTKSQWGFITQEHYEKLQKAAKAEAFTENYDAFNEEYQAFKTDYEQLRSEFYATRAYFDNAHESMTDVWLYVPIVDIWKYPRVSGVDRHGHATPKPVKMLGRIAKSSCTVGGLIVDPFSGTGTTIMASEQFNRCCYAMEIAPKYVQVTIERWENYTGQKAVKL